MNYDLRFVFLLLINLLVRPQFGVFFTDYTESTTSLFKAALLCLFSLWFVFTSIKLVDPNRNEGGEGILVHFQFGREMSSPLLVASFVFSILCPTPVFLYVLLLILLCSLSAPCFHLIIRILVCLRDAFFWFIASPPPPPQTPLEDQEDGFSITTILGANQNGAPPGWAPAL